MFSRYQQQKYTTVFEFMKMQFALICLRGKHNNPEVTGIYLLFK